MLSRALLATLLFASVAAADPPSARRSTPSAAPQDSIEAGILVPYAPPEPPVASPPPAVPTVSSVPVVPSVPSVPVVPEPPPPSVSSAAAPLPDAIATGILVPYAPLAAEPLADPDDPGPDLPAAARPPATNAPASRSGVPGIYSSVPLPPQTPSRTAIHTRDNRFIVGGMTSAENLRLAGQISEWATAIEARIGRKTPWLGQGQVIGITVPRDAAPNAPYRRMQGWESGRFYQRIATPPADLLDPEDLQTALAATLLTRCAAALAPAGRRNGLGPRPPDWLSVGVAQSIQASVGARNRDWVAMELADRSKPPMALSDILRLRRLPPGRWREKAYAHAAADFLAPPDRDPAATFAALLAAIARDTPIDDAFLRSAFPDLFSRRAPDDAFRDFLARWARPAAAGTASDAAPRRFGGRDYAAEQALLRALLVRPADWVSGLPPDAPAELPADALLTYRNEPWAAPLATALRSYLLAFSAEASPALQHVFAAYEGYFEFFRHPPEPLPERRLFRRTPRRNDPAAPTTDDAWLLALTQLWRRARDLHQAYLRRQEEQSAWLDAVEESYLARQPLPAAPSPSPDPSLPPPRTPIQRYLDTFAPPPR